LSARTGFPFSEHDHSQCDRSLVGLGLYRHLETRPASCRSYVGSAARWRSPSVVNGQCVALHRAEIFALSAASTPPDARNATNIVLAGIRPVGSERSPVMPGFAVSMRNAQMAGLGLSARPIQSSACVGVTGRRSRDLPMTPKNRDRCVRCEQAGAQIKRDRAATADLPPPVESLLQELIAMPACLDRRTANRRAPGNVARSIQYLH